MRYEVARTVYTVMNKGLTINTELQLFSLFIYLEENIC